MNRFRLALFVGLLWQLSHNMLSSAVCTQSECGCVICKYISGQDTITHTYALSLTSVVLLFGKNLTSSTTI